MKTLEDYIKKYELQEEQHYYHTQSGKTLLTRRGIDHLIYHNDIQVELEVVDALSDKQLACVIKATATMVNSGSSNIRKCESFGSVNPNNNKNVQDYPVELCEKRAVSRAVLKVLGLYSLGVYSEDEFSD